MHQSLRVVLAGSAVCLALSTPASADLLGDLTSKASESLGSSQGAGTGGSGLGSLGSLGSSLGLPSLGGDTASNAAGVLQYCAQNKLVNATSAENIKGQLMGKLGMEDSSSQQQDSGYQQGLGGVLSGSDGSSFDLNKLKGDLKEKACDYVLDNAPSLL